MDTAFIYILLHAAAAAAADKQKIVYFKGMTTTKVPLKTLILYI